MVLEKLGRSLDSAIRKIRRLPKVDKDAINALIQDLQRSLLGSDVKVELVFEMTENIKKEAMNTKLQKAKRKDFIISLIHDELVRVLGGKQAPIRIKSGKKNVILLNQFDAELFFELRRRQRKRKEKLLLNQIEQDLKKNNK